MTQLSIKSEAEARAWNAEVERLNQDVKQLLEEIGETLQEVKEGADSTIVDEIYKYGSQILSSANKVFEGMNELHGFVNNVLSKMNEILETGKNLVGNIVKGIAGLD